MRHSMACWRIVRLGDVLGEGLAGGDADLFLHQVAAVDFLRHAMLDLDAGVHFHEIKTCPFSSTRNSIVPTFW